MIENALWKILGFILAIILIFIAPLITIYDRQDDISYSIVYTELNQLADSTRDVGGLDEGAYIDFLNKLTLTGNQYKVQLEHHEKVYVPIYDSTNNFTDEYYIAYDSYYNEDIEGELSSTGFYGMAVGDLFYIHVENISKTKSQVIRQLLYGMKTTYPSIVVRGGGMIRHEHN